MWSCGAPIVLPRKIHLLRHRSQSIFPVRPSTSSRNYPTVSQRRVEEFRRCSSVFTNEPKTVTKIRRETEPVVNEMTCMRYLDFLLKEYPSVVPAGGSIDYLIFLRQRLPFIARNETAWLTWDQHLNPNELLHWHTHLLHPVSFRNDMKRLLGNSSSSSPSSSSIISLPDNVFFSDGRPVRQDRFWSVGKVGRVGRHSAFVDNSFSSSSDFVLDWDLTGAVRSHLKFRERVKEELQSSSVSDLVSKALSEYPAFMANVCAPRNLSTNFLSPTLHSDLAWHTHLLHPSHYSFFCRRRIGTTIDHVTFNSADQLSHRADQRTPERKKGLLSKRKNDSGCCAFLFWPSSSWSLDFSSSPTDDHFSRINHSNDSDDDDD